jgi:hypothetical protein
MYIGLDKDYPGTAIQRLNSVHTRVKSLTADQLNGDWVAVRRNLLMAGIFDDDNDDGDDGYNDGDNDDDNDYNDGDNDDDDNDDDTDYNDGDDDDDDDNDDGNDDNDVHLK